MKKLFYFFTLALLYILFLSAPAHATVLSDCAAALQPGQFVNCSTGMVNLQLTATVGFDDDNPHVAGYGGFTPGPGYDAGQPAWDNALKKLYIETSEHGRNPNPTTGQFCPNNYPNDPHGCWKALWTYDDPTNTWTVNGPAPHYANNAPVEAVHVWGMIAYDNVNKTIYVKRHSFQAEIFRYCAANSPASYCATQLNDWKQIAVFSAPNSSLFGQIGWHPHLNGGTLLYFEAIGTQSGTCGGLFGYTEAAGGTWTTLDPGTGCKFPAGATTQPPATYSTIKDVVIFGPTGSTNLQWWKINSAGTVAALDTAPCSFITTDGGFSQIAEDPNTGDFIFIGCTNAGKMYRLNPTAAPGSQWTLMHATLNAPGQICNVNRNSTTECGFDFYVSPISTYGVIGIWKFRNNSGVGLGNAAEYWLYKPSVASGDIIAPTVAMTAPANGATVSGAAVTVSATASDNVGVVGVQFKLDGANLGAEDTSSPYSISWDSTTASNGSHAITATARDAAGNTATSTGVSVTVTGGVGSDFTTRCKAFGVFFCNGFDTAADLGGDGWGNARGHAPSDGTQFCGANNCPTIDTVNKISGAGAMKFTIPPGGTGTDAGGYWANPSTDFSVRFGAGQTWYVQFRQKVSTAYFAAAANNNKIHWISSRPDLPGCSVPTSSQGNCFSTCTENEVVNQNQYPNPSNAIPRWYTACPDAINNFELITPASPGQYDLEPGRAAPGCLYDNVQAGNIFPPNGNCFPYSPDQWVTWSYKITLGSIGTGTAGGLCYDASIPSIPTNKGNCYYGGQMLVRAGLDGQPLTTVLNWTGPMIAKYNTNPTELKYGKVFFAPYTGVGSVLPTGATMWFDELIMSTSPIADPGAAPDTTNPTVAITSPIPPTTSSTTSPITVSGTAADNVTVTSVTWTCIQCVTKGGTATSSPGASISWLIPALDLVAGTNTLNVVAHDAAGNVSTAATLTITYTPVTTRYASTTGGGTACTVITTPCTLTVALGQLLASETLFLRAGTYTTYLNGDTFNWPSGTPSAKTTIAGYPVEVVIIRPVASESIINMSTSTFGAKSYIKFQNLILDGGAMNSGTQVIGSNGAQTNIEFDHITIQNNPDNNAWSVCATCNNWWIHDSQIINLKGGYGIYNTASGTMFEHNTISGGDSWAIHNYNSGHNDVSNNTYRYNTITNQGQSALYSGAAVLASGSNNAFYGNLVYNNLRAGLVLQDCTDCAVYNNTIYGNGSVAGASGLLIGDAGATPTRPIVRNNIIAASAGANVTLNGATSPTNDHNLCDVAGTWCDTVQAATAIFINPATANFRLNTGSSALNTGATLAAPYDTDILGLHRPQGTFFDLGAYELNAAIIQPVVTIVNPTAATKLTVQAPLFSLGGTSNLP